MNLGLNNSLLNIMSTTQTYKNDIEDQMNLAQNVCLDDFKVSFETGSLGSKTRSPGQIKGKTC